MSYTQTVLQASRRPIREQVALIIVGAMKPLYFLLRSNRKAWSTSMQDLSMMPQGTLGNDLAHFLQTNHLTLLPKAEFHDVYHVLFGFGTTMKEETCIQFLPAGNGRRSLPLLVTIFISLVVYPEYSPDFYAAYKRGKNANQFYDLDFEPLLLRKTSEVRELIFSPQRVH